MLAAREGQGVKPAMGGGRLSCACSARRRVEAWQLDLASEEADVSPLQRCVQSAFCAVRLTSGQLVNFHERHARGVVHAADLCGVVAGLKRRDERCVARTGGEWKGTHTRERGGIGGGPIVV
jgi:hypothetical protein